MNSPVLLNHPLRLLLLLLHRDLWLRTLYRGWQAMLQMRMIE
jgi:hypothetical protein